MGERDVTIRRHRPDEAFVAAQRARGMSWPAIGGLLGCSGSVAQARYGGAAHGGLRDALWRQHAPEAVALTELLDQENAASMVGAVYLAVLHKWLSAKAGPSERAALLAFDAPLANSLTNERPVPAHATAPVAAAGGAPGERRAALPVNSVDDWRAIGREVAADHDLTLGDLLGRVRTAHVSFARCAWWWRLYGLRRADGGRRYSMATIARLVGRDVNTIETGLGKYARISAIGGEDQA